MTKLSKIGIIPSIKKISINHGMFLKNIPAYITIIPIKISARAQPRIRNILLPGNRIISPQNLLYTKDSLYCIIYKVFLHRNFIKILLLNFIKILDKIFLFVNFKE